MPTFAAASATASGTTGSRRAVAVSFAAGTIAVVRSAETLMTEGPATESAAWALVHRELGNRPRWRHIVFGLRQRGPNQWTMPEPGAGRIAFLRVITLITVIARGGCDRIGRIRL
jgi:hypothetical protein